MQSPHHSSCWLPSTFHIKTALEEFIWIPVKTKWHAAKPQYSVKVGQSAAQNLSLKSMTKALWNILLDSS